MLAFRIDPGSRQGFTRRRDRTRRCAGRKQGAESWRNGGHEQHIVRSTACNLSCQSTGFPKPILSAGRMSGILVPYAFRCRRPAPSADG